MENFANIAASAEQLSVNKFVHHVKEAYSINKNCLDLFENFRRQALLCLMPMMLGEVCSELNRPIFPGITLLPQCDFLMCGDQQQLMSDDAVELERQRQPNEFLYKFGDVMKFNWYRKFLHPNVRARMHRPSTRYPWSDFRSFFRLTPGNE